MLDENPSATDDLALGGEAARTAPVRRSRKRRRGVDAATLGVAALVLLGAGGLYYMHFRTAASTALISHADASAANVQTMVTGGRQGLATLSHDIEQTRSTIDALSTRDGATLANAQPLGRDPFEFHSLEPRQLATDPESTNVAAREAARARALSAAKSFQVQSIMYGSTRRSCLVDGKLYFEGQPLGEFTIARIAPDAVTVQSGEFKFELHLRK